jgi:hypothetical protein
MKLFVYPNIDNKGVIISSIIDESLNPYETISKDGIIINDTDIPLYANDFFDAVEFDDNKKLIINIDKSKEITKNKIRNERECFLNNLDVIYQRALESGRDLKIIEQEKQRLRDLPEYVNNIDNLKELLDFKVESTLKYSQLPEAKNSSDNPEILMLQKQNQEIKKLNEDLALNLNDLISQMNTLQNKLKKKYII